MVECCGTAHLKINDIPWFMLLLHISDKLYLLSQNVSIQTYSFSYKIARNECI